MNRWICYLFAFLILKMEGVSGVPAKSLDEASLKRSRGALSQGFEIHKIDLLSKELQSTGANIFENLDLEKCVETDEQGTTSKDDKYFSDTESLYSSIATDSKIDASVKGAYTLGVSVAAVTNNVATANKQVTGVTLIFKASSLSHSMKKECIYDTPLSKQFLRDFQNLNEIEKPWLSSSWRKYKVFFQKYGTHIVKSVEAGSSIYQYVFTEDTDSCSQRDLTVKACLSLAGPSQAGEVGMSACSEISKKDRESASKKSMITKLVLRGGTSKTRADLINELGKDLINKFLQEGETDPSPIQYEFIPLWRILRSRYISSDDYYKVSNLEQYYKGYRNFGCSYRVSANKKTELQKFELSENSAPETPIYVCNLAPESCHSDDDCHYEHAWWCSCAGESCVRIRRSKESSGLSREIATIETSRKWGWHGCSGAGSYYCTCTNPKTTKREAWKEDDEMSDLHMTLLRRRRRDEAAKRNASPAKP